MLGMPCIYIYTLPTYMSMCSCAYCIGESCSDSSGNSSMITLHNRVTARHFHYDCYDIYGQVSEAGQTKTISDCVTNLVSNIQRGTN